MALTAGYKEGAAGTPLHARYLINKQQQQNKYNYPPVPQTQNNQLTTANDNRGKSPPARASCFLPGSASPPGDLPQRSKLDSSQEPIPPEAPLSTTFSNHQRPNRGNKNDENGLAVSSNPFDPLNPRATLQPFRSFPELQSNPSTLPILPGTRSNP
nr:sporozoite surface protein 2-like [Penaeus vannamei]